MRTWIVWLIALTWSAAVAASPLFPPDAEVFLTAESGTIVGVGRISGGRSFEIRVLWDFSGPARFTLVAPGEVSVFDVWVRGPAPRPPDGEAPVPEGAPQPLGGDLLLPDGTSLFASLRASGVIVAWAWAEASDAADHAAGIEGREPGIEGSSASDTGRENANPRASEGGNPRSGEENPGRKP
jgi:hypothetical protein